jgi:glutamine---fructose-6-phosphate transaminase (isomerizing)
VSQSGEAADTLGALREARRRVSPPLASATSSAARSREVGGGIYLHAGLEIGVASTKVFTV